MIRADLASAGRLRLQAELLLWRYGWHLPLAVLALVLALVTGLVWLPAQYLGLQAARAELARAEQVSVAVQAPRTPPLQQFREVLAQQDATPTQLRVIHQKAVEAGLSIAQIDMRRQQDAAAGFSQLQVSLPVKGNYQAVKRFLGDVLGQMPSVSIDQFNAKREQVSSNVVEAQISLSIWQQAQAPKTGGGR